MSGSFEKTYEVKGGALINARSLAALSEVVSTAEEPFSSSSLDCPVVFTAALRNRKTRKLATQEDFETYISENGEFVESIKVRVGAPQHSYVYIDIKSQEKNYATIYINIESHDDKHFEILEKRIENFIHLAKYDKSFLQTVDIYTIGFLIFIISASLIYAYNAIFNIDPIVDRVNDAVGPAMLIGLVGALVVSRIRRIYFVPIDVSTLDGSNRTQNKRNIIVNAGISILIAVVFFILGRAS